MVDQLIKLRAFLAAQKYATFTAWFLLMLGWLMLSTATYLYIVYGYTDVILALVITGVLQFMVGVILQWVASGGVSKYRSLNVKRSQKNDSSDKNSNDNHREEGYREILTSIGVPEVIIDGLILGFLADSAFKDLKSNNRDDCTHDKNNVVQFSIDVLRKHHSGDL